MQEQSLSGKSTEPGKALTHMHVHACGHATGPDLVPQPSVLVVPAQLQPLLLPRVLISSLAAAFLTTQVPGFPIPPVHTLSADLSRQPSVCSSFCLYLA